MALFVRFDLKPEFDLSFLANSHFLAFMCPNHNDTAIISLDFIDREAVIPDRMFACYSVTTNNRCDVHGEAQKIDRNFKKLVDLEIDRSAATRLITDLPINRFGETV